MRTYMYDIVIEGGVKNSFWVYHNIFLIKGYEESTLSFKKMDIWGQIMDFLSLPDTHRKRKHFYNPC